MLFLGSGTDWAQVQTPRYDFPDELIAKEICLFSETLSAGLEEHV